MSKEFLKPLLMLPLSFVTRQGVSPVIPPVTSICGHSRWRKWAKCSGRSCV